MQKYIFLESTASFHQNRIYRVNTGQTMSTRVKNEFRAVSGPNCFFDQNRVHQVNTGQTMISKGHWQKLSQLLFLKINIFPFFFCRWRTVTGYL
jgi:hypothetical protein